tara:strand:+ start:102 stop:359 length:258 start_codon:yes stop_codon:yes gene_type:complete
MTTAICFDLMEMIGKNVVEFQETTKNKSNFTNLMGELNDIFEEADKYIRYNVEERGFSGGVWDGERVGNSEWEYAFWEYLECRPR